MMETLALPLVITKLHVPAIRPHTVPRTYLVERLSLKENAGLVLVCAPAGYGKTTLLAGWVQLFLQKGGAVAWYAIDASDDVPVSFGSYLVASLMQALGPIPELMRIAQLLRSSPEMDIKSIPPAVINAVASSGRDCVLILDDYHLIGSPAIHSMVAFLLERLPQNMHLVIGSRSDPPLPLARLRARGRLVEMRSGDLRFTADEAARFLNDTMQLDLAPEAISVLEKRTEGWVAGLQLVALSLSGRSDKESFIASFSGSHRYLVEYLLEEVFSRQPEQVQSFLLSTSVLERLCGSLCNALTENQECRIKNDSKSPSSALDAQSILAYLEHSNLFLIPLDDEQHWYRYHHLFRDFLQTRLQKTRPECVDLLHRSASAWYAAHDFLREAVQHALLTHDWNYAAALVERHSFTMIIHSEISTIHEWCSVFPEEVMQMHPLLCILQCWAWVLSSRQQNRGRIEVRLRQAEQLIAEMEDVQASRDLAEHASVVRNFLVMIPDAAIDPQEYLALARQMLAPYPEGNPGQFSALLLTGYAHMALHDAQSASKAFKAARQSALCGRLYFGVVESTFHLARLAHSQGLLRYAAEICRQGKMDIAGMLANPERELPALGCLDIALGCILLEQDKLEDAEQELLHGLDLIGWRVNPYHQMIAFVALAHLRQIQGRPAEALGFISRLEETWPDIAFCTRGLRVMHALRMAPEDPGVLADATAWCQTFVFDDIFLPGMGPFGAAEVYYLASLAWARAQIAVGNINAAQYCLERQLDLAAAHGLMNRVIELSLLESQSWRALGEEKLACAALERALAAAQPEGYLRIFDQDAALNKLLIDAANHSIFSSYIRRILAVIDMPKFSGARWELDSGEHISEREREVLRLIAQGATNYEIAEQLVITVGTVKSHINHIFVKLDAHNRTEAVARARGLGLLEI